MRRVVIAHGGTASKPDMKDGTDAAVQAGMRALREKGPVHAVVEAVVVLEDDERFNAGTGSNYRFDGETIEMDAAVMDSRNKYGGVAAITRVKNPVRVAHDLMSYPSNILGGEGATRFAHALGHEPHDPGTDRARKKWEEMVEKIKRGEDQAADNEWNYEELKRAWNFKKPFEQVFGRKPWPPRKEAGPRVWSSDTVGAVATDGKTFAAATSTGGVLTTIAGRVGDSPNIGTGIFAGECGAVVLTGNGDHILRERAATEVHKWLGEGFSAQECVRRLPAKYSDDTDVWAAVLGLDDHAGGGNREIAWSAFEDSEA